MGLEVLILRLKDLIRDWRAKLAERKAGGAPQILKQRRRLNLALQGGGAHGAFSWGVIDRLLEESNLDIAAASGASAGAINAVALDAGLMEGGRAGARTKLAELWRGVGRIGNALASVEMPKIANSGAMALMPGAAQVMDLTTRVLSPYEMNPMGYDPLREILDHLVDFERLRRESPLRLHVSATDVADGSCRLFHEGELTLDMVMASACLPQLHHAVKIGERHYWDGGFTANPPLLPLMAMGHAPDTLLVRIVPGRARAVPTRASEISARLNDMLFNEPLKNEVRRLVERKEDMRHRFHLIDASESMGLMPPGSRMIAGWPMLCRLRDEGRAAAENWLRQSGAALGRQSSVDLAEAFL